MAANKLRLQSFRTNDLVNDGGKQFELGKSWCDDFFEFDKTLPEVVVNLKFKAIQAGHVSLNDKIIELKLADVSTRGDRKAYVNGNNGMSQIKDFFINDLHLTPDNNLTDFFAIYKVSEFDYFLYFVPSILYKNFLQFFKSVLPTVSVDHNKEHLETDVKTSLQQIFYGAPGTGKSNTIKRTVDDQGKICFRTTFHPDSDYSTFVGCYKPTMKRSTITKDGVTTREEKIVYRFEPQAFTNAYVQAWKSKEDVYLVIEEINRGNCAQIFGDLFQLLDRKNGESEYPINADTALADYLQVALADSNRDDIPVEVKSGMKLKLPSNLYIWATMNTSDQSLFPIDSAFKRRWDWTYIPINQHDEGYRIKIDTVTYDWWGFLEKINQVIGDTTSSEDKKLGYFFVKAEGKEIGADKFVSKVLFYLWNDVFKNYGFDNPIFSRGENKKFAFSDFFTKEGAPETSMVNQFLRKLDETIDKENSFEKIPDVNDSPSSLMVKYNGESIEGTSARNKYVELVKLVVAEKGSEQVANCIGAELTRTPAEGSTRMYKPIGDTGWYLATNNGIDAIKRNINKIKEALDVNIEIE
ncbi:MAG: AAA family ATPase [Bacteroidaceae bacterium]|nr:AAA family ATPase [Bacteroidaceae bacterium]